MKRINLWIGRLGFVKCAVLLFVASMFLGILASSFYFQNPQNSLDDFYCSIQTNITETGITYGEFLQVVLWKQLRRVLILLICSLSFLGPYCAIFFVVYNGFTNGFFLVSLFIQWGIKGGVLFCASGFPQILFYIPLYLVLVYHCYIFNKNRARSGYKKRKTVVSQMSFFLILFGCFFFGCLSEAYLNVKLVAYILSAIL